MAWDPRTYLTFGAERTRPAAELLARVPVEAKYAVDLGCGPGNSTALLRARWPKARLEGVDNSPDMLADAQKTDLGAEWIENNITSWTPAETPDVIFSNAAFQWVPDHNTLLPGLMSFLKEGGVLAFQVPRNFDDPCHTLIHEIAANDRWAEKLEAVRDWWNVLAPEEYYSNLEPHAVRIDIWETRYVQVLEGEDAVFRWMSGTGLRPYANALEGEERDAFLNAYKDAVNKAYPMRASGKTLYPFRRLFAVAVR